MLPPEVEWPLDLFVFQRGGNGLGEINARARVGKNETARACLQTAAGQTLEVVSLRADENGVAQASFKVVAPGFYRVSFKSRFAESSVRVGVGDLFLVAGQSNAVSTNLGHPPPQSISGMTVVNDYYEDQGPGAGKAMRSLARLLVPSSNEPITSNVCWVYCGDMLVSRTGVPVGFLNVAVSSTNSKAWNPASGPLASMLLETQRIGASRAVLWQQGESDVLDGLTEEESYANLKALIEASHAVTPGIIWIVARNSHKTDLPYKDLPVRRAQERVIREGLALMGPDTDQVRENPRWVGFADFGAEGLRRNGELWHDILLPFVLDRSSR